MNQSAILKGFTLQVIFEPWLRRVQFKIIFKYHERFKSLIAPAFAQYDRENLEQCKKSAKFEIDEKICQLSVNNIEVFSNKQGLL